MDASNQTHDVDTTTVGDEEQGNNLLDALDSAAPAFMYQSDDGSWTHVPVNTERKTA